jgi:hypothetical protein
VTADDGFRVREINFRAGTIRPEPPERDIRAANECAVLLPQDVCNSERQRREPHRAVLVGCGS